MLLNDIKTASFTPLRVTRALSQARSDGFDMTFLKSLGLKVLHDSQTIRWKNQMPKYAYRCDQCGKSFIMVQSINDEPIKTCYLRVGGNPDEGDRCQGCVRRIPAKSSFSLKGKGWYKDGY